MVRRIHHVGIVVERLADAYRFYRETLSLPLVKKAEIPDQKMRAALLRAAETEIELLEPLGAGTGVGRFLAKRGEGLHHVCFETPDIDAALAELSGKGAELIDRVPRPGLAGRIAFLHPRACSGILVELATPAPDAQSHGAGPLALKRLVVGARDPRATAALFQRLFALPEVAMNGGPRAMLAVGRAALLIVPAAEVGETEGVVALSFVAADFAAVTAGLDRAGTPLLRGTGEVTIEPAWSHGVPVHISRFWFP